MDTIGLCNNRADALYRARSYHAAVWCDFQEIFLFLKKVKKKKWMPIKLAISFLENVNSQDGKNSNQF